MSCLDGAPHAHQREPHCSQLHCCPFLLHQPEDGNPRVPAGPASQSGHALSGRARCQRLICSDATRPAHRRPASHTEGRERDCARNWYERPQHHGCRVPAQGRQGSVPRGIRATARQVCPSPLAQQGLLG
eukprot:6559195-Prymnesium_polylepis.1